MKKILIYSNMAPSEEMQYAGVFVQNQFNYLQQHDRENEYSIFSLKKTFTGAIGSIKKYISFISKSFVHIKREKFDIIHLHYFFPLAIIPWYFKKTRGTKLIATVHGSDLYAKMKNPLSRSLFRYILKSYDYLICVGIELGDDFQKIMEFKPDKILCAGVNNEVFFPQQLAKDFDFVFAGSLIDRKGFDMVLKVIKQTIKSDYKWCVVGTGEYGPEIKEIAENNPSNCQYFERLEQPELNLIFNRSSWVFFPSRNEPFGLVASEAVFAGTPVICSDRGGLKEQVKDDVNGYIITNPDDVNECIGLLQKAYTLNAAEYDRLAKNCLTSNGQFSLSFVCGQLEALYNQI